MDYPPIANDDSVETDEEVAVSGNLFTNDEDFINPPVLVISNTDPANGTVIVNADGTFTYTPNTDFYGIDTFEYTIKDVDGDQDTGLVTIRVNPVNDTPIAVSDSNITDEDTGVSGNLMSNDMDLGDAEVNVVTNTNSANGTVVVQPDGSYTYIPNENFTSQMSVFGDSIIFDDLEIFLKSSEVQLVDNMFYDYEKAVLIQVEIKNLSGEVHSLDSYDCTGYRSNGIEIDSLHYYFDCWVVDFGSNNQAALW